MLLRSTNDHRHSEEESCQESCSGVNKPGPAQKSKPRKKLTASRIRSRKKSESDEEKVHGPVYGPKLEESPENVEEEGSYTDIDSDGEAASVSPVPGGSHRLEARIPFPESTRIAVLDSGVIQLNLTDGYFTLTGTNQEFQVIGSNNHLRITGNGNNVRITGADNVIVTRNTHSNVIETNGERNTVMEEASSTSSVPPLSTRPPARGRRPSDLQSQIRSEGTLQSITQGFLESSRQPSKAPVSKRKTQRRLASDMFTRRQIPTPPPLPPPPPTPTPQTETIDQRREIVAEQNRAFQEALMADQAKQEKKRLEEEEKLRKERREEERRQAILQAKEEARSNLPTEPNGNSAETVVNLHFRLPSGASVQRNFRVSDTLRVVFQYVYSNPETPEKFDLFRRPAHIFVMGCLEMEQTLLELRFQGKELLVVRDLDLEDEGNDSDEKKTEQNAGSN